MTGCGRAIDFSVRPPPTSSMTRRHVEHALRAAAARGAAHRRSAARDASRTLRMHALEEASSIRRKSRDCAGRRPGQRRFKISTDSAFRMDPDESKKAIARDRRRPPPAAGRGHQSDLDLGDCGRSRSALARVAGEEKPCCTSRLTAALPRCSTATWWVLLADKNTRLTARGQPTQMAVCRPSIAAFSTAGTRDVPKSAFSLNAPAYLKTPEADSVRNLDGLQALRWGGRFRGLKLWFVLQALWDRGSTTPDRSSHRDGAKKLRGGSRRMPTSESQAGGPVRALHAGVPASIRRAADNERIHDESQPTARHRSRTPWMCAAFTRCESRSATSHYA